ncbi:MAG TPA: Nif3-like dinuclear metal center hexameric protein [Prolixibacteraceae bacterium]|nr:Nif3-like dinuclear metal center hexameric protein [Prolixibacteraceae bacterium]
MKSNNISRRKFLNMSGTGMVAGIGIVSGAGMLLSQVGCSSKVKITAGEVMDRIKKNVGVPWREVTVDTIKGAGTPDIVLTGITTSFMATLDVLEKSVKAGNNFILAHEPTFWTNLDKGEGLEDDALYAYKQEYIRKNGLFVHRFHDHWHARKPDGIDEGWKKVMGWDTCKFDEEHNVYELPQEITLADYAKEVKGRLRSDSIRVVGDPQLKVLTVSKGSNKVPKGGAPYADVTIHYEPDRENNNVEWERDIVASGQPKGFIIVSHNRKEEDGMDNCATWLKTFISEVPVQFIPSGNPFWRTV